MVIRFFSKRVIRTCSLLQSLFILFLIINVNIVSAQQAEIWKKYLNAVKNGEPTPFPDFSYVGYKFLEEPIPNVNSEIFDVTKYGANGNDQKSDKKAIVKALDAAKANGGGIIYFPKGKYYVNTPDDKKDVILITSSNIVFRGEGADKSTIFFQCDLPPKDPAKMWTVPKAIKTYASGSTAKITDVIESADLGSFVLKVKDASQIKSGQWITLNAKNNSKEFIDKEMCGIKTQKEWTSINNKGIIIKEIHLVKEVKGNTIILKDPIVCDVNPEYGFTINKYAHLENVGFENLTFEGNWIKKFIHHHSAQYDSGWGTIHCDKLVNSWIRNCVFKNVTNCPSFTRSAACSVINNIIEGNIGHSSISMGGGSTGILIARLNDKAGMWHAVGVGNNNPVRNVIYRCSYPENTCFEAHASQPRYTLWDNVSGGFFLGRAGGARFNLPNHMKGMVLWNYQETDEPEVNFSFWSSKTWYWKIVKPTIVGFHHKGNTQSTTFDNKYVGYQESIGKKVMPESLLEAQLKLRLGKVPKF